MKRTQLDEYDNEPEAAYLARHPEKIGTDEPPDLHKRKCHDCVHIDWYSDWVKPGCLCTQCGSADTRRIKLP